MVGVSDQLDPDDDPLHGLSRETLDSAREAAEKLGELAHGLGLHIQQTDFGVTEGPDGPQVVVAANFLIGELAWSDRVQNPEAEVDTDVLADLETQIMRDKAAELRERMRRKPEGDASGSED
jgi:hypothetical protein